MAQYTVLLDANVLYPAPLRDVLVEIARNKIYKARWTNRIHDEWIRNLLKNRSDIKRTSLERTRDLMNEFVPNCLVTNYEYIIDTLELPDPDDRHVLAAAMAGRCDAIITFNLHHFPKDVCMTYGVDVLDPDTFLCSQMELATGAFCGSIKEIRQRLRNPPQTIDEYLGTLKRQRLVSLAAELQQYADVL